MKKKDLQELHTADIKELEVLLQKRQQELMILKMELHSGKNKNWRGLAAKRDDIARIKTIAKQKEVK